MSGCRKPYCDITGGTDLTDNRRSPDELDTGVVKEIPKSHITVELNCDISSYLSPAVFTAGIDPKPIISSSLAP